MTSSAGRSSATTRASLAGRRARREPDDLGARDVEAHEQPRELHVVERHRLLGDGQVDAVRRDHGVERVEVRGRAAVHLDDPAVLHHQRRLGVVRAVHRDQPEPDVLVREAVEVDPLLVHEPDATDRLSAHCRTLSAELTRRRGPRRPTRAARAQAPSSSAVPPLTPTPPTTTSVVPAGQPAGEDDVPSAAVGLESPESGAGCGERPELGCLDAVRDGGERLVDGERRTGDLGAVHALEVHEVPALHRRPPRRRAHRGRGAVECRLRHPCGECQVDHVENLRHRQASR